MNISIWHCIAISLHKLFTEIVKQQMLADTNIANNFLIEHVNGTVLLKNK